MILPISSKTINGCITKKYMIGNKLCTFERYIENGITKWRQVTFEYNNKKTVIAETLDKNGKTIKGSKGKFDIVI